MPDPTLLPVGHYHGRSFPGADRPLSAHRVRLGLDVVRLTPDEFVVWSLAHGLPDRAADAPWSRQEVEAAAREDGVAAATAALDGLLRRGAVVAVADEPGRPDGALGLAGFARAYRLEALLHGLGTPLDDPASLGIGVLGFAPLLTAGRAAAGLWQWAPLCADLHEACALLARGAAQAGEADPEHTDASRVLAGALPALRRLISHSAAYLDVAGPVPD